MYYKSFKKRHVIPHLPIKSLKLLEQIFKHQLFLHISAVAYCLHLTHLLSKSQVNQFHFKILMHSETKLHYLVFSITGKQLNSNQNRIVLGVKSPTATTTGAHSQLVLVPLSLEIASYTMSCSIYCSKIGNSPFLFFKVDLFKLKTSIREDSSSAGLAFFGSWLCKLS